MVILQSFCSLNYADLANVKCLILHITTNLKKIVFYVLGISPWWIWVLHNYNFQLKAQILLLAINPDSYFCKWQAYFFSFSRKCLSDTQVWITVICLSVIILNKNSFYKKAVSSYRNSNVQVLFLRKPLYFIQTSHFPT